MSCLANRLSGVAILIVWIVVVGSFALSSQSVSKRPDDVPVTARAELRKVGPDLPVLPSYSTQKRGELGDLPFSCMERGVVRSTHRGPIESLVSTMVRNEVVGNIDELRMQAHGARPGRDRLCKCPWNPAPAP